MPGVLFRRDEVALRNTRQSAAVIIDNVVYDVTEFLVDHPGGIDVLLQNAGGDASQCFHDVAHSEMARNWALNFVIGEVVAEERRAVLPWPPSVIDAEPEPQTLSGQVRELMAACSTPLLLGAFAAVAYMWLFGGQP
ncbi:cytochrome b5-like [Battus philenor]|uniref:cytochrome b5-like n=1 Tax=Battus philenor TaxID=42288 RepID=UPI0035CF459E